MEIKTFDTILTGLCDSFDELISPRTISRSNTNIIYLIFKAISKGLETINNVCVVLSNKFNPATCSDEDLTSTASLVGTEKYSGSASGLRITVTNNKKTMDVLLAGIYTYALDDDTKFEFEVLKDTDIYSGDSVSYIAMSENIGSYAVTEQNYIVVTSDQQIPSDFTFSCGDNSALLGTTEETDLEFRKRIQTKTDRQNTFVELEDEIKNLPYIFDCQVTFNNTLSEVVYDDITVPSYTALICYSGEIKQELAEKVCSKIICPTVQTKSSVAVTFEDDVFVGGGHTVYFTPFNKTQFGVEIIYKIDSTYTSEDAAKTTIRTALFNHFVSETHEDYVKEDDVYNLVSNLDITGVEILSINLIYDGSTVNYVEVPKTRIAELTSVTFIKE